MNDKMIIKADGAELFLERTFAAPRERVWAAFTECQHLTNWWGPKGWDLTHCDMDFRVGGRWHYCMTGKNPETNEPIESWGLADYTAINAPTNYTYTDAFSNAEGGKVPGMPVSEITMEFVEVDGGTKVLSRGVYASAEELKAIMEMGVEQGITETWDRLEEFLAK